MEKKEIKVKGYEAIERKVQHFKGSGSRVSVPKKYSKVMIVWIE